MGRHLLCCDTWDELSVLKDRCKSEYVAASGSFSFYKDLRQREQQAVFLESDEMIPYDKTWEILDSIHAVMDQVSGFTYSELFHFSYEIDSGFPMKIAWMIINLNFIHNLVQTYNIKEISLIDKKENWIMNECIFLYAHCHCLVIHIYDEQNMTRKICLKTLETINISDENMAKHLLFVRERAKICEIRKKKPEGIRSSQVCNEETGALYCCQQLNDKHVDWLLRRVNVIGDDVKIICFYKTGDEQKFQDRGWKTDCLEDYFLPDDFDKEYKKFHKERERILQMLKKDLHVQYLQVDLSGFLYMKIRNYFHREILELFYMDVCMLNYFRYHKFKYIHIWGNSNFWETRQCYKHTVKDDSKLFYIGMNSLIEYRVKFPYQDIISALFIPKRQNPSLMYSDGWKGKSCLISDVVWALTKRTKNDLRIPEYKKSVAILPGGVCNGLTTFYFYYNTLLPLMERLLEAGFRVVFKNHPGYNDCWEKDVKKKFETNDRFVALDGYDHVDKALDLSYIIITDISAAIYDAAVAQKAAFCMVDKQGYQLISRHEKGFSIYMDPDRLLEQIELVVKEDDEYRKIVEKQNAYISETDNKMKKVQMEKRINNFLSGL